MSANSEVLTHQNRSRRAWGVSIKSKKFERKLIRAKNDCGP